jgi:alpha-galactosidase
MGKFTHDLGLGFGVYSDSGIQMCMTGGVNQTGSLGQLLPTRYSDEAKVTS